jgi:hypothetical protein
MPGLLRKVFVLLNDVHQAEQHKAARHASGNHSRIQDAKVYQATRNRFAATFRENKDCTDRRTAFITHTDRDLAIL